MVSWKYRVLNQRNFHESMSFSNDQFFPLYTTFIRIMSVLQFKYSWNGIVALSSFIMSSKITYALKHCLSRIEIS